MRKGRCSIVTSDPLGCQIKARLAECGGICEVARVTGVKHATVYSWIKGTTRPKGDHLESLAAALHTTPEELLSGSGRQHAFTLDELAVLAVTVYSGSPWASYGKLKSYIDTHGGELPQLETEAKEVTRNGRQYRR